MKTVLVTGANGQWGNSLRRLSVNHKDFEFLFTDVAELDICDEKAVNDYFHSHKIDYVMNCAAYTNVNKAEEDEAVSLRINSDAVHNLGLAARVAHARMIHISTDYVFDGTECRPYVETDLPCPVSAYGRTKLAGEDALGVTCPESVIIRTAWLYSEYGNNFVKTMLRLAIWRKPCFPSSNSPNRAIMFRAFFILPMKAFAAGMILPARRLNWQTFHVVSSQLRQRIILRLHIVRLIPYSTKPRLNLSIISPSLIGKRA